MSERNSRESIKVAWALNSGFYYWHPLLAQFAKIWTRTKVFVVGWQGYLSGYENSFKFDNLGHKKVISLPNKQGKNSYNIYYVPLNIINKLLAYKPQVVLVNSFGVWTLLALLLKAIGGWRVIVLHEGCSPLVDFRDSRLRIFVRHQMMKAADACLTNGKLGKAFLVDVLGLAPEKAFIYPYPLPPADNFACPQTSGELGNLKRPIFLFVGRIISLKGLNLLFDAAVLLREQGVCNYTILIVGDGEDSQQLEDYCRSRDLTQNVCWIGEIEYDHLAAYFQLADAFVLPTLADVWGMVVLEAMVVGKPILCSKFAGVMEMIREGENGYVFDPHDVRELASLMRKFIDNPELSRQMGAKSREIMNLYTPESAAQFFTEIVEFVLSKSK